MCSLMISSIVSAHCSPKQGPMAWYRRISRGKQAPDFCLTNRARLLSLTSHRCKSGPTWQADRKSTRLNSSHQIISYAVFCLKKKKQHLSSLTTTTPHNTHNNSLLYNS